MSLLDILCFWRKKPPAAARPGLREIFQGFQQVLAANNDALSLMGDLEEKLSGRDGLDLRSLRSALVALDGHLARMVAALGRMSRNRWPELQNSLGHLQAEIHQRLEARLPLPDCPCFVRFEEAPPETFAALGGKAANLARMAQAGLPVPPGTVATVSAYRRFLQERLPGSPETLKDRLSRLLAGVNFADDVAMEAAAAQLQALVLAQPVPEDLARGLVAEARRLAPGPGETLVVRSSGSREDVAATFAGLYDSFLGASPEEVPERWRQVVASQFSARALRYVEEQGLSWEDAAMAVCLQRLIRARAAGVMFTTDPDSFGLDRLLISASFGLAPELVGRELTPDTLVLAKENGLVLEARRGRKEYCLALQDGRLVRQSLPPEMAGAPVLTPADLDRLAHLADILEDFYGGPQDVEWVLDEEGSLFIVQSRPLRISLAQARLGLQMASEAVEAEVLLKGGRVGSLGVAAGPVFRLLPEMRLSQVDQGAVLVIPRTTPLLAPVLSRVAALVADVGSPTGHLALVAREYGVPALVDAPKATEVLPEGQIVTVDAFNAVIYQGRVEEVLRYQPLHRPQLLRAPVYERLRAVLDLIVPLTTVDFRSPDFRAENCRTYHDITCFAHEKAMQTMLGLMDQVAAGRVPALKLLQLKTDLPLNLHLVDLGDGLASYESPIPPEDIVSVPMRALWQGISYPGISWAGPVPVSLGGFLHVIGQSAIRPPEDFWDKTYAIVAAHYVNYACRLGYHFQSVDSYCGPVPEDNYINFNFKGGAADELRRIRRARLIALVVGGLGFEVEQHLDVIRARFRKRPQTETEERLDLLGRLMAYVRQMDMLMANDELIHLLAERFLAGHYERPGEPELHASKDGPP